MIRLLKQLIKSEAGQALPIVLALLVLGGLTIVPSLNYAATSLNSSRIINESIKGVYAADAGVEEALWNLSDNTTPPAQLTESVNQMDVSIQTEDKGVYTIVFGELVEAEGHSYYLGVVGDIEWDGGEGAYKYTITVTWQPGAGTPTIHLTDVGAKLPLGYEYKDDSADDFPANLSTDEPEEVQDGPGAWMLNWELDSPYPTVTETDPVETQVFYFTYVTGTGELEGDYAWVVANRNDIDQVGEITGGLYVITAMATKGGVTTAKIVADVMIVNGEVNIISWQVSK